MYLSYREANNSKWRQIRYLIEPEPDGNFKPEDVDLEEAAATPKAEDGSNLFENPNCVQNEPNSMEMDGRDGEQVQADEAMEALNVDPNQDEMEVADMFGDFIH